MQLTGGLTLVALVLMMMMLHSPVHAKDLSSPDLKRINHEPNTKRSVRVRTLRIERRALRTNGRLSAVGGVRCKLRPTSLPIPTTTPTCAATGLPTGISSRIIPSPTTTTASTTSVTVTTTIKGPAASAEPSTPAVLTAVSVEDDWLGLHNKVRAENGAGPLTEDPALTASATAYAKELGDKNLWQHSGKGPENLYMMTEYGNSPARSTISVGVQMWADEKPLYKGEVIPDGNFMGYGHYTQMIWKKAKKVGCGSYAIANRFYGVCHYDVGNVSGQRP